MNSILVLALLAILLAALALLSGALPVLGLCFAYLMIRLDECRK